MADGEERNSPRPFPAAFCYVLPLLLLSQHWLWEDLEWLLPDQVFPNRRAAPPTRQTAICWFGFLQEGRVVRLAPVLTPGDRRSAGEEPVAANRTASLGHRQLSY